MNKIKKDLPLIGAILLAIAGVIFLNLPRGTISGWTELAALAMIAFAGFGMWFIMAPFLSKELAESNRKMAAMIKILREIVQKRGGAISENGLITEFQKIHPLEGPKEVDTFYRCLAYLKNDPNISLSYTWKDKLKEE
jgi:hypothetical protein